MVIHPNEWEDMGWIGNRGAQINIVTEPHIDIDRIMKDIHSSLNVLAYGYAVTGMNRIKEPHTDKPPEERPSFEDREYVYRVVLEPIAKFLMYGYFGHYGISGKTWYEGAPTKP